MYLRHSWTSPFVRKVMVVAWETGLADRIHLVPTSPLADDSDLPRDNPLGKIPALTLADGVVLYDSPVICEYLDHLAGGGLFPPPGPARWMALRRQALADGIMDAAVACRLELTQRPETERSPKWMARWRTAAVRGAAVLATEMTTAESPLGPPTDGAVTIGDIAAACSLAYLDLRFPDLGWRTAHPALAAWHDRFSGRRSMVETVWRA